VYGKAGCGGDCAGGDGGIKEIIDFKYRKRNKYLPKFKY